MIVCATNKRFHTLLKKKENSILIEVINHFTYHWSAFLSAIFAFVLVGFDIEPILYPKTFFLLLLHGISSIIVRLCSLQYLLFQMKIRENENETAHFFATPKFTKYHQI